MVKNSKPNLFVVGMPKTGTTTLYELFKQHPEIYVPREKEINYFATILKEEKYKNSPRLREYFHLNAEDYLDYYKKSRGEKYRVDITPIYLYSKIAAQKIKKFNPEAYIIAIFREPVDFLYSLHSEFVSGMMESEPDFQKALSLEDGRKASRESSYFYYSEWVDYSKHLSRFLTHFPRGQIKVLFFKNFKKNNVGVFRKIENFLGLEEKISLNFNTYNPNKVSRFKVVRKVVESPHFWINAKRILPESVLEFSKKIYYKLVMNNVPREKLDEDTVKRLKKRFKENVIEFEKLLKENDFVEQEFDLIKFWGYDNL